MADNPQILGDRGRALEDEFFRKEDQRLIERLRELRDKSVSREALALASGIKNEAILDKLLELGIRPETVAALALVPLAEVAWADGSLDDARAAAGPRACGEVRNRARLHRPRASSRAGSSAGPSRGCSRRGFRWCGASVST